MINEKIVKTISNLLEFRGQQGTEHTERIECFLRALVEEMYNRDLYTETLHYWNMEYFFQSAALHDVGKIGVPEHILLKNGKLNSSEFNQVKNHARYGEQIIERIRKAFPESKLLSQAQTIAGTHHEKWDGSGYPRSLAGEQIPLEGRCMALVDAFDALISERNYRKAYSMGEALQIIKAERGTQFDPQLTDAFISTSRHLRGIQMLLRKDDVKITHTQLN